MNDDTWEKIGCDPLGDIRAAIERARKISDSAIAGEADYWRSNVSPLIAMMIEPIARTVQQRMIGSTDYAVQKERLNALCLVSRMHGFIFPEPLDQIALAVGSFMIFLSLEERKVLEQEIAVLVAVEAAEGDNYLQGISVNEMPRDAFNIFESWEASKLCKTCEKPLRFDKQTAHCETCGREVAKVWNGNLFIVGEVIE